MQSNHPPSSLSAVFSESTCNPFFVLYSNLWSRLWSHLWVSLKYAVFFCLHHHHSCCSVTESCLILWDPMNCSTPVFPVLHRLPEFAHFLLTMTHVYRVSDAIQPSYPLLPPSPLALNSFQHQGLFTSVGQSIGTSALASVLPMNIQDWFPLGLTGLISLKSKGTLQCLLQHHSVPCQMLYCKQNIKTRRNWNFVASLNFPCEYNILTSQKEERY